MASVNYRTVTPDRIVSPDCNMLKLTASLVSIF